MIYAGSNNETKQELGNILGKGDSTENIHKFFSSLIQSITSLNANYTLDTANKVFIQNGFPLVNEFIQLLNSNYFSQFQSVDFLKASETAKIINDFAEEKTHGKIKDLVSPSSFNAFTRLVLVNAIYFKGKWATPFEKENTQKAEFYVDENKSKKVDMMFKTGKFLYNENDDFQVLSLPYVGNSVHMYLILPKQKNGLSNVVKSLNASNIFNLFNLTDKVDVEVKLPRFKIESEHELVPSLISTGIKKIFTDQADLTGVSQNGSLSVSNVVQKAFIETNEEGTEAAAATSIILKCTLFMPVINKVFTADHPFLYFIIDNKKTILFSGVVRSEN